VSKDSDQTETAPRKFKLGPLGNLNQVTKGLAKTIRAMADGTLDSQVGARIRVAARLARPLTIVKFTVVRRYLTERSKAKSENA